MNEIEIICKQCGKKFYVKKSTGKRKKYCDECIEIRRKEYPKRYYIHGRTGSFTGRSDEKTEEELLELKEKYKDPLALDDGINIIADQLSAEIIRSMNK